MIDAYPKAYKSKVVRAELAIHAKREAQLERMHDLAVDKGNDALVERVETLIAKEDQRHADRMNALQAKAAGGEEAAK